MYVSLNFKKKNRYKLFLLSLSFCCFQLTTIAQVQIGKDIDGEAKGDQSGCSVSMPDSYTIGIGAYGNDGNGQASGHVRIYNWIKNTWVQKGSDIDGESINDLSGNAISMPDNETVAIGAYANGGFNGTSPGQVRIYKWRGNNWTKKGKDIDGEAVGDESGYSVSMPDSNTVAIGAYRNDGNGTSSGHVRIYHWVGNEWGQKGSDIDGEARGDASGYSISMPDSNTVAIGAPNNNGNGSVSGHVRIYRWAGNKWVQKGNDIDGEKSNNYSGKSVCMPDSNTVAIGAPHNSDSGAGYGHVRIYKWKNSVWVQKGNDIDGEAKGDYSGVSISMPDSNVIAIGAILNDDSFTDAGHVRLYIWNGNSWVQKGNDIDGEGKDDESGGAVSMPDKNTVAIGAIYNNGNGGNSGHVRIYSMCKNIFDTLLLTSCNSYTSPSGKYTWTNSGTYHDTISNSVGCDSLFTINLVVKRNSSATIFPTVCGNYVSPSKNYTWTISGKYHDTISNSVGCDSLITINLTVKSNSSATISPTVCGNYVSPSGNYTWTRSGTYHDTIANVAGCDSLTTINLTVNNKTDTSIFRSVCESYTSPSRKYIWTKPGTYYDTIPNVLGCDSIITVFLKIQKSAANISFTVCEPYLSPSGKYIWTTSGTYKDTIPNTANCDSIITIDLTIDPIVTTVSVLGDTLIANEINATYLWLNCKDSMTAISSAINQFFVPMENKGSYAVILEKFGCIDTSECVSITRNFEVENIKVFPNPSKGIFNIDYPYTNDSKLYKISDVNGKVVHEGLINKQQTKIDLSELASGIYLLRIGVDAVKLVLD